MPAAGRALVPRSLAGLRSEEAQAEQSAGVADAGEEAPQTRQDFGLGIYAGNVWLNAGGTLTQIAIRARFDGTVDWYWVLGE